MSCYVMLYRFVLCIIIINDRRGDALRGDSGFRGSEVQTSQERIQNLIRILLQLCR